MNVTTWRSGSQFGIRVGKVNRDQYFDNTWSHIEVEMDGNVTKFALTPGFWRECPEFRDREHHAIRNWLQQHKTLKWTRGKTPRMSLVPIGSNRFRLEP
jgi:hypothetical protein